MGGVCPNASENGQISPSASVRSARDCGSRPRRQAVLSERGKSAKIHPGLGFIWRIPVKDLEDRLQIILRGAKRRVIAAKPDDEAAN
jgi:hypothetical protein